MANEAHFDESQFAGNYRKQYPVSAEVTADGWRSPGLDYSDYVRMGLTSHKSSGERRLPTPIWAVRNSLLQELILHFLESRAAVGFWNAARLRGEGISFVERLDRAKSILNKQRAAQSQLLDALCKEFVETDDPERKRTLRREIESLDTLLVYTAKEAGASIIAAVVVLYYRVGIDSVGVGMELGLKPTHVRRILWNLHQCATKMTLNNALVAEAAQTEPVAYSQVRSLSKVPAGYKPMYAYRNQMVALVEDQGKLLRIRNEKGETLSVEAKTVTISYVKENSAVGQPVPA